MSSHSDILCKDPNLAKNISLDVFKHYLERNGWRHIADYEDKLNIFEGPKDDFGEPIELLLPTGEHFLDASLVKSRTLKALSVLEDCSIDEMKQKILKN